MVPEISDVKTAASKDAAPQGNVDEELKEIYEQMKTRRSEVPDFIKLLKDGSLLERRKSADALGEIGDERGVLPLIDAMKDASINVQYVAIKSLGMLADRRAVDPLIDALRSDEKWVRLGAAHSLGQIGDKKAVEFIIPLLADPKHGVRAHAAWALGKLGDARASNPSNDCSRIQRTMFAARQKLHWNC